MEQLQENQEKMMGQIDQLKTKMKAMRAQSHRLEGMLTALCKAQDVDYTEEDFSGNQ